MRAGPRPRLDAGLLSALREAITTCRLVEFRYLAQSTGLQSHQRVKPLGLLYGNRAFLVASSEWKEEPRLWRLANVSELRISEETFERDPDFDLERYAKRSFGTFQEEPVEVVLLFAPGAAGMPRTSCSTRSRRPSPPAAHRRCHGLSRSSEEPDGTGRRECRPPSLAAMVCPGLVVSHKSMVRALLQRAWTEGGKGRPG